MARTLSALRVAAGATAFGIAANVTALAAPASAAVTSIGIQPSFTLGVHRYGTTCSYTVDVTVNDTSKPVFFFEEGQGPSGFAEVMPGPNGVAKATWIPSRPGIGYIYAYQLDGSPQARQVTGTGTGINVGSACIAL